MKKIKKTILFITAIIFVLALSGCKAPLAELQIPANGLAPPQVNQGGRTRTVYVSGAVENDGYIEIPQICDYKTLYAVAEALPCANLPYDVNMFLPLKLNVYIADYYAEGIRYYSHNVNSLSVQLRLPVDGADDGIINKLADYIAVNGKITNRIQLKAALLNDYAENYYKFFIDEKDYAQDS